MEFRSFELCGCYTSWAAVLPRLRIKRVTFWIVVLSTVAFSARRKSWKSRFTLVEPIQLPVIVPKSIQEGLTIGKNLENVSTVILSFPSEERLEDLASYSFPSIDDRVRYYMGGWYYPRSINTTKVCKSPVVSSAVTGAPMRRPLLMQSNSYRSTWNFYLGDANTYLLQVWNKHATTEKNRTTAMFSLCFGDLREYYETPTIVKTRPAAYFPSGASYKHFDSNQIQYGNDPIIIPLETKRHFDKPLSRLIKRDGKTGEWMDRPWHEKNSSIVWRGVTTGYGKLSRAYVLNAVYKKFQNQTDLINIGFTGFPQLSKNNKSQYAHMAKHSLTMKQQLHHKYLLSLEGNDVASGLKWMLYSNSVVFMPVPTCISWAMEERLLPWYHYVPLRDDLTDLAEKIAWCQLFDDQCHKIAQQATQYMNDLWVSGKAKQENIAILTQMVILYQKMYGQKILSACQGKDFNNTA